MLGAAELVTIVGWADHRPHTTSDVELMWDEPVWQVRVPVPASGRVSVDVG